MSRKIRATENVRRVGREALRLLRAENHVALSRVASSAGMSLETAKRAVEWLRAEGAPIEYVAAARGWKLKDHSFSIFDAGEYIKELEESESKLISEVYRLRDELDLFYDMKKGERIRDRTMRLRSGLVSGDDETISEILEAIKRNGGRTTLAAKDLGIPHPTMLRWCSEFGWATMSHPNREGPDMKKDSKVSANIVSLRCGLVTNSVDTLSVFDKEFEAQGGVISRVSASLGIPHRTMMRWLKEFPDTLGKMPKKHKRTPSSGADEVRSALTSDVDEIRLGKLNEFRKAFMVGGGTMRAAERLLEISHGSMTRLMEEFPELRTMYERCRVCASFCRGIKSSWQQLFICPIECQCDAETASRISKSIDRLAESGFTVTVTGESFKVFSCPEYVERRIASDTGSAHNGKLRASYVGLSSDDLICMLVTFIAMRS